jgi:tRNA G18 (ribose-2'-O)-methylase SpoU
VPELAAHLAGRGVALLGIDNLPGARPLEDVTLPEDVCLLFGQEGPGLSDGARAACAGTLSIAQYGSTRSINASAAAAIAMPTWVVQHAERPPSAAQGGVGDCGHADRHP